MAPKIRELQKSKETLSSFENWRGNLIYNLTLNPNFAEFLDEDCTWKKKSEHRYRGFSDITETDNEGKISSVKTAAQRASFLDLCLGMIAGYAPVISRNTITKECCSMKEIFQKLRSHYGFAITGSSIIDVVSVTQKNDESPEDVYQRIKSLIESCLLSSDDELCHHGSTVDEDEVLTPTLENLICCIWLKSIHPSLPSTVKQRYATQLKNSTISSIREEISSSIPELLLEINERDHVSTPVMQANSHYGKPYPRNYGNGNFRPRQNNNPYNRQNFRSNAPHVRFQTPSCFLCQQAGRPKFDHKIYSCPYLPNDGTKRILNKARLIECLEDHDNLYPENPTQEGEYYPYPPNYSTEDNNLQQDMSNMNLYGHTEQETTPPNQISRVTTKPSPYLNAYYNEFIVKTVLDTGATVSLINERLAKYLGLTISPSSQSATQADGKSDLDIIGETRFSMSRKNLTLYFEGLVVRDLEVDVLAGIPFMEHNDIGVWPSRKQIWIGSQQVLYETTNQLSTSKSAQIKRVSSFPVISDREITLFPNDYLDVKCTDTPKDSTYLIDPAVDNDWITPDIALSVDGNIRIRNNSCLPVKLCKNETIASILNVTDSCPSYQFDSNSEKCEPAPQKIYDIKFNPQNMDLDNTWYQKFQNLHEKYKIVFGSDLPGYNGKFGNISAYVNIGDSLPPQRKGKIPQYSRNLLSELQDQFDQLESIGVFAKPEDVGTYPEYINPSFLVKKPDNSYRLVTSFGEVAAHNKPTPTATPSTDSVIQHFGRWKYIIKTDLKKAYFQIPLHPSSRKYCGVNTPFKGVRVYCRAAMGMPGSESALDELMSRILGDLIQAGLVQRVADDLYIGGDDLLSVFRTWEIVLKRFLEAGLRLSAPKTEIFPMTTSILGWIWSQGKLSASPHHTSALSTCDLPKTVKALRSFIGAYKVVSRVLEHCSQYISPLESLSSGKQSADSVNWSPDFLTIFKKSQEHLKNCRPISLPSPNDKLWLTTDACSSNLGIGSTLTAGNPDGSNQRLASFFSAKLKKGHQHWLPCEIECLAIATSINHFRPLILESDHKTSVLTDSKPAVQAYEKFLRGEFSSSSRMQAFLLAATQNNVTLSHIKGINNALSDFESRNSSSCNHPTCSVCKFVNSSQTVSVNAISVKDILNGTSRVPFSSHPAWLQIQLNCPSIQLARKHLQQGTRPLKKQRNIKEVRQLLRVGSVTKDGLLVVNKECPLQSTLALIVIPQSYISGLLTALHLQLDHPTTHQLKQVFHRQFYCVNADKQIETTIDLCHLCLSLRKLPSPNVPFSTSAPYENVGSNFSADILRRATQKILVLCEEVTKFTQSILIDSEDHTCISEGLKQLLLPLHPPCSPTAKLKLDPGPGNQTLYRLQPLQSIHVIIELGEAKNKNKLATVDKIIQELENELIRLTMNSTTKISQPELSLSVASLNSRIRSCGLSSFEQWHKRNQFSNQDINISDQSLINAQASKRYETNSRLDKGLVGCTFKVGSIVYIINEKSKHCPRPRYIVDSIDGVWLFLRKLTDTQLRSKLYKIHKNCCTKINEIETNDTPFHTVSSDSDDSDIEIELNNGDKHNDKSIPVSNPVSLPPQAAQQNLHHERPVATPTQVPISTDIGLRRSDRQRQAPPWLADYSK